MERDTCRSVYSRVCGYEIKQDELHYAEPVQAFLITALYEHTALFQTHTQPLGKFTADKDLFKSCRKNLRQRTIDGLASCTHTHTHTHTVPFLGIGELGGGLGRHQPMSAHVLALHCSRVVIKSGTVTLK